MLMVDTVVEHVLCAARCVVCVLLLLPFFQRGTYLGVCWLFFLSDSVVRFCRQMIHSVGRLCGQILSSDFVHKTFLVLLTSRLQNQHARALGTNQRSRARLTTCLDDCFRVTWASHLELKLCSDSKQRLAGLKGRSFSQSFLLTLSLACL
jgi:hypothetical protein